MDRGIYSSPPKSIPKFETVEENYKIAAGTSFSGKARLLFCNEAVKLRRGETAVFRFFGNGVVKSYTYSAQDQDAQGYITFGLSAPEISELVTGTYGYDFTFNLKCSQPPLTAVYGRVEITAEIPDAPKDVMEHDQLLNRELPEQHPIGAITGLNAALIAGQNVIEVIRSNGVPLPVRNKSVDLPTFAGANGFKLLDGKLYLTMNGTIIGEGVTLPTGGGGGGGQPDNNAVFALTNTSGWLAKTIAAGSSLSVSLAWSSLEDDIPTGDGILTVTVGGVVKAVRNIAQGAFTVDVTPYLTGADNTISISVRDTYGNFRTINYNITVVSLSLSSTFNGNAIYTGAIDYFYTPVGAAEKTVHFILDGVELPTVTVTVSGRQQSLTIPAQTHGAHSFEVYFTAEIDGQTIESNHLYYDLITVEDGNNTPIISSTFSATTAAQYDTLIIPYIVYVPNALTAEITLAANGTDVSTLTVDRAPQTWLYRPDSYGEYELTITSGETVKTLTLNVTQTEIDVEAETNALELYLDSYGRSNNEAPAQRETWTYNDISAVFTDFNWISDGWQIDENNNNVLRVGGDARLYIPLEIFGTDFRNTGKTIELEFATRNVLDYQTTIMECLSGGRGLEITPQKATLTSEQSQIYTQYKENEHIRLSFVVEKSAEYRLIYVYVNGIMSGVTQYPISDDFSQGTPVGLSIGSNDCTVDIYNIRVYANSLTRYQILDNWIADTQNITEKLARYNRNNIFNAYGDIVINKLPADLPYFVFEAAELPTYKGDKRNVDGYYADPQNADNDFTFTGAQADVQGTSSQYYARKNFKVKFKNGFIRDGMTYSTYQMRGADSIGTNTFTFKADVASSEGANNVELVRLYNDISPYRTPPQEADPRVRQGIDGFPMVVFQDSGDGARFIGKYNFNNDKGTPEVFGFSDTDESWEVLNNDSARVMFKSGDFNGWEADFEARYPEESTDIENLQRFVAWVASTDQSAATGEPLLSAEEYGGVTYTTDTAAYRLAKFRYGIEDYVELDSALFYYLFTEFFLMIDSRAKNMFPSRFYPDRWCFLPYDFDTAIGINNVGALSFGYDLEDIDQQSGTNIFNGQPSVLWINLRAAFYDELAAMYRNLRANTVFNYSHIIDAFAEHQNKWCEAIWNEDAFFKYLQPLTDDGDGSYLEMLLGSKAEQRKWWLYNRFKYLDSKYVAGDASAQSIVLRMYSPEDITITPYASIYAAVKFGSQLVTERALNGEAVTLECPFDSMGANGTETMIYSADQILDVGDLSGLKVGFANFSAATRLSALKLGDSSPDYSNGNLTNLQLGNNTLLRSLDVRNSPNLAQAVDISGCTNIEYVYFDGTAVTGVALPVGGIIKTLHLPSTITNLTVRGQQAITDFVLPDGSGITTLWLENVSSAIDSLALLNGIAANSRVRLLGVDWTIDTELDAETTAAQAQTMRGIDLDGQNLPNAIISGKAYITDTVSVEGLSDVLDSLPDVTITVDGIDGAFLADGAAMLDSNGDLISREANSTSAYDPETINEFLMQTLHFLEVA